MNNNYTNLVKTSTTKTVVIRKVHGDHDLFTPSEVMKATGMKSSTFKYRRRALNIPGQRYYTLFQVEAIVNYRATSAYVCKHDENVAFLTEHFKMGAKE